MSLHLLPLSPRLTRLALIGLAIGVAAVLGRAVVYRGATVLAGLLLVPGGLLLLSQPVWGLFLLTASLPVENVLAGAGGVTGARLLGMAVFGAWLFHKLLYRESWRSIGFSSFFYATLLLLLLALTSSLWARYRPDVYTGLLQLGQLFFWSLLVIDLTNSWSRMDWVAKLLVMAALVTAILTVEQYFVQGVKRAGDDLAGGVNGTAAMLVSIMPFAFYLLRARQHGFWRLLGLLYVILGSVAVVVTFSRTSYLALPGVLLIYYWETLKGSKGRGWLIFLTGVIVVVATFIPQDLVQERIESIVPAFQGMMQTTRGTANATDSRGFHWAVGLAMFNDHPLLGVGFNNYGRQFAHYQVSVPGASQLYRGLRSPHSSYIAFLANQGLLGLGLWLAIFGIAVFNLVKAWSALAKRDRREGQGRSDQFLLVQAVTYTLLLQIFYGWALTIHQDKFFWLILGLSVSALNLAKLSDRNPQTNFPVESSKNEPYPLAI